MHGTETSSVSGGSYKAPVFKPHIAHDLTTDQTERKRPGNNGGAPHSSTLSCPSSRGDTRRRGKLSIHRLMREQDGRAGVQCLHARVMSSGTVYEREKEKERGAFYINKKMFYVDLGNWGKNTITHKKKQLHADYATRIQGGRFIRLITKQRYGQFCCFVELVYFHHNFEAIGRLRFTKNRKSIILFEISMFSQNKLLVFGFLSFP